MAHFFGGILFLYLSFEVDLTLFGREVSFDILPDIVGYILFYLGLKKLQGESERFDSLRKNIIPLIVISALVIVLAFVGLGTLGAILAIVEIILAFYATHQIVWGIGDMEEHYRCDLRAPRLKQLWKRYLVLQIVVTAASLPVMLIALLGGSLDMLAILAIVTLVAGICIIVTAIQTFIAFHFAEKQYSAIQAGEEPKGGYRPAEDGEVAEAETIEGEGPEGPQMQYDENGESRPEAPFPEE